MNVFDLWLDSPVDVRRWRWAVQEMALWVAIRRDFAAHLALGRPLGHQGQWFSEHQEQLRRNRARLISVTGDAV